MKKYTETIFIEYGLDFYNNKYGLGKSTEVESADGSEHRTNDKIRITNKRYYFRFWLFKRVFIISNKGISLVRKERNNFKIVLGISVKRL